MRFAEQRFFDASRCNQSKSVCAITVPTE